MQPNDSLWATHFNYLGSGLTKLDDSHQPIDLYMALRENADIGDIHRMIDENFTAFYTGERSIDEYDDFLAELDDNQDWINAMTAQMQESWAN